VLIIVLLSTGCSSSNNDATNSKVNNNTNTVQPAVKGTPAPAVAKDLTFEEIANLKGPDREKILIEGAKKEGKLTWYTTLIVDQAVRPLLEGFGKKYPFIKVNYYRGNNSEVLEKAMNEHRSKQYSADIIDGTDNVLPLEKADMLQKFYSNHLEEYPVNIKDVNGLWAATNLFYSTIGYNTDMIPKDQVPKTYEDLLDPKWKGKMAWNSVGLFGGPGFVGNILRSYGDEKGMEYLEKFSKQNIINMSASARAVLDRSIAGEFPIALQVFSNHPLISAKKGAPSNWQPLEPVLETPNIIMMLKNAPNPYSVGLFIDFVLDKSGGQEILKGKDYIPAHPEVAANFPELKPEGHFKASFLSPEEAGKNAEKWNKVFKDLFMK
jgi:ABC-type Fe3+ transport system substrate-binding protein